MNREIISSLTHLIGALLSVAGLVLLVVFAAKNGNSWQIISFSLFGASLILAYCASAFYHIAHKENRKKEILRRIDHAMIYVLIAGTYTPIALVPLRGGWGWSLFGVIWGLAIIGIIWKLLNLHMPSWLSSIIYLLLGWLIIIAIVPLLHTINLVGFLWLLGGGISYSIGVIFFGLGEMLPKKRWFGMHEIFHLFVMLGSFCHWWMMFWHL